MFSNYTSLELLELYKSIRNVQDKLLCDRCEGYLAFGDKYECVLASFCQELCAHKAKILEELENRGNFRIEKEFSR